MKIRRGPSTSTNWTLTDEKLPAAYVPGWRPGASIHFDGTIDKSGQRHTDLGVSLDEKDIIALHGALLKHYQECVKERDQLKTTVATLEDALIKIASLVSWQKGRAPAPDDLLSAVEGIAGHFGHSWNRDRPFKSAFKWLKWKTL